MPSVRPSPRIQVGSLHLFGNDAADLEQENLFFSYAVHRQELKQFLNADTPILIARAYKGEGKSALLRLVRAGIERAGTEEIVIATIGPDLSPPLESLDQDLWTREWKKNLLKRVAVEVGARLGVAFTDDAISLVEEAEASGFKRRALVSAIIERLKSQAVPIERTRIPIANYEGAGQEVS
jgi:hypothetical protein